MRLFTYLLLALLIFIPAAIADSNFTLVRQTPIEVQVHLGNDRGELRFFPKRLQFVAGKRYKLLLNNPSPQKHYFTAKDFADAIWTQKVEAGKVEVKGAIHEVEIKTSAEAEWVLIPLKPGNYELHCSVKGHAKAGMVGSIEITS